VNSSDRFHSQENTRITAKPVKSHYVCRGLLIILILLGHNKIFYNNYYHAYEQLYNFHVECFLILPFIRTNTPDGDGHMLLSKILEDIRRLYVPLCCFIFLYSLIFYLKNPNGETTTPFAALFRTIQAIIMCNTHLSKVATGFELFWFVPAFIILRLINNILELSNSIGRMLLIIISAALHLASYSMFSPYLDSIPWSLPIVAYLTFPCLGAKMLAKTINIPGYENVFQIVFCVLFILILNISFYFRMSINLSDFKIYDYRSILELLCVDLVMISASFSISYISDHVNLAILNNIGRMSFQIYLIHGMLGYAIVSICAHVMTNRSPVSEVIVSLTLTVCGSFFVSSWLMRTRLGKWVFHNPEPRKQHGQI
jgi:peptidoglycan/LPS O-acetylase OafA/YrhL